MSGKWLLLSAAVLGLGGAGSSLLQARPFWRLQYTNCIVIGAFHCTSAKTSYGAKLVASTPDITPVRHSEKLTGQRGL